LVQFLETGGFTFPDSISTTVTYTIIVFFPEEIIITSITPGSLTIFIMAEVQDI